MQDLALFSLSRKTLVWIENREKKHWRLSTKFYLNNFESNQKLKKISTALPVKTKQQDEHNVRCRNTCTRHGSFPNTSGLIWAYIVRNCCSVSPLHPHPYFVHQSASRKSPQLSYISFALDSVLKGKQARLSAIDALPLLDNPEASARSPVCTQKT